MSLLSPQSLEYLREGKNLLAFSAGVDSSALFFLLREADIAFDIALVNYRTRTASDREADHARQLAHTHGLACHIETITLPASNFEHRARAARYAFFERLIARHGYDTLITAHQLDDRLEWMLMQLTKGAGVVEMAGFSEIEAREGYRIVRPLLESDKASLLAYLHRHDLPYFVDKSNRSDRHRRNDFRERFAAPLLAQYREGIRRSFRYLQRDSAALFALEILERHAEYYRLRRSGDEDRDIRQIDRILKRLGYLLSAAQKREIMRQRECVVSDRFVVALTEEAIHIAPCRRDTMPKSFKEACRKAAIPPKIRPYLYTIGYMPSE